MNRVLLTAMVLLAGACASDDIGGPLNHNPEVPNAPQVSSIGGKVYEVGTGVAIEGAIVSASATTTQSAVDGRYELTGLTSKVIVLEATKGGYQPRAVQLPINPGHNDYQLWMQKVPY